MVLSSHLLCLIDQHSSFCVQLIKIIILFTDKKPYSLQFTKSHVAIVPSDRSQHCEQANLPDFCSAVTSRKLSTHGI